MTRTNWAILSLFFTVAAPAQADKNANHFPSLDAPTASVAFCNLKSYNEKLNAVVTKDDLTPLDMVKVHELTYTLENALARLQADLTTSAAALESVHLASEDMDQGIVQSAGQKYITAMQNFVSNANCD